MMRAIIIEEDRFAELIDLLSLECTKRVHDYSVIQAARKAGVSEDDLVFLKDEMFRTFNLHLVRWAQSHGARCVR